jgi:eukaryotic-like serine/threonine-protein kinase
MSCPAIEKRAEQVGRYAIFEQIAAGGMATVHLARIVGSAGFSRVVAAKRMHRQFLQDPEFTAMFLAEARLAARVIHPNVVPILDVLEHEKEVIIVMEYVHGESLRDLTRIAARAGEAVPVRIGCAILVAALQGLHAAHEARSETGEPLRIIHRDVSPQNVLVGADGVARVLDFGIAKAVHSQHHTNPGMFKGKLSYLAPEVINGAPITRQVDIFSAGVLLWEILAGRKLFRGACPQERLAGIVSGNYPSPRQVNPRIPLTLERIVAKALELDTSKRYQTALDFAIDIESVLTVASQRVVSDWVRHLAAKTLHERTARIQEIETAAVVQPQSSVFPTARVKPISLTPIMSGAGPDASDRAPISRRRVNRRTMLVTGGVTVGVFLGALLLALLLHGTARTPPSPQSLAAPSSSTPTAPAPSSKPPPNATLVKRDPDAPGAATVTSEPVAPTMQVTETRVTTRRRPPRAATPRRAPAQSSAHIKPYLPNEL